MGYGLLGDIEQPLFREVPGWESKGISVPSLVLPELELIDWNLRQAGLGRVDGGNRESGRGPGWGSGPFAESRGLTAPVTVPSTSGPSGTRLALASLAQSPSALLHSELFVRGDVGAGLPDPNRSVTNNGVSVTSPGVPIQDEQEWQSLFFVAGGERPFVVGRVLCPSVCLVFVSESLAIEGGQGTTICPREDELRQNILRAFGGLNEYVLEEFHWPPFPGVFADLQSVATLRRVWSRWWRGIPVDSVVVLVDSALVGDFGFDAWKGIFKGDVSGMPGLRQLLDHPFEKRRLHAALTRYAA